MSSSRDMQQLFDEYLRLQTQLTQCVTRMLAQHQIEKSEEREHDAPINGTVKRRVLHLLMNSPDKAFGPSVIARILKASKDSVYVALHWLVFEKQIIKESYGLYRAIVPKE